MKPNLLKTIFLMAVLLLSVNFSFAQSETIADAKETVQTAKEAVNETHETISSAERIIDKYSEKFYNGVSEIVEGLKGPAETVFKSVVRLQIAKGIGMLLILIPTIIFWIVFARLYPKVQTYCDGGHGYRTWDEAPWGVMTIVALVAGIIFTIGSVFAVYHGLLRVFAPEWFAIMEIVQLVK